MISITACDGYKYYGPELPAHYGKDWYEYRANGFYLAVSFSDWQNDQLMLKSLMDAHVSNLPFDFVAQAIEQYVVENQTPELHCAFWQQDDVDNFQLKTFISTEKPVAEYSADNEPIMVDEFMARKRTFYAAELKRYHDEADAVREEEARQEIARAERRQKRLAREAVRQAQGYTVPVAKKPPRKKA
jgi:hypothetical protein